MSSLSFSGAACGANPVFCEYMGTVAPAILANLQWALIAISAGFVGGFFLGWARISRFRVLRGAARGYTELIRGTPLVIQIFAVFYTFPALNRFFDSQGFPLEFNLTGVQRVIIALVLNTSAYQAEIFRAGFQSIASGQIEAATSVGMTRAQTMRHIILPQSLRIMAPPLTNEYIIMFKDATPLAFIVAIPELVVTAQMFGRDHGIVLESYLMTAGLFLVASLLLTVFLRGLEHRFAIPGLGISVRAGG